MDGVNAPGPVGLIYKHVIKIGWSWPAFEYFEMPGGSHLPISAGPDSWWQCELRQGIRRSLWSQAAARRNDMHGMQVVQGIDDRATVALLNSKPPPDELGLLRGVISGSIRLQKRLHDAALVDSPVCPFCGECDETLQHCFWDCPQWSSIRMQFDIPAASVQELWPTCTRECGIFIEDAQVIVLKEELAHEAAVSQDIPSFFKCVESCINVAVLYAIHEQQVLWTDGACANNQDQRFRRAGDGIFYGTGHPMNASMILPGYVQSNQRAELLAVVVACMRDPRPLDIRTDSEYVCNGFAALSSWKESGWKGDHADLWNLLASALHSRVSEVCVSWVKGHAKRVDIARWRTTEEDKKGNDGADALAVAGAHMHRVPEDILRRACERKQVAKCVQKYMVAVLKARLHAEAIAVDLISDSTNTCAVLRARLHAEAIAVDLIPDSTDICFLNDEVSDRESDIVSDSQ